MRRVPLDSIYNLRDLGGYPAADGRITKYGRFYRCDAPVRLTANDESRLAALNIRTVIDLRSDDEVNSAPCALRLITGVDYRNISPIIFGEMPGDAGAVPGFYVGIAGNHDAIYNVMRAITRSPGTVLFHCTAGKDRTGVVAAMLLSLAGVAELDIVADYQVSHTYLAPLIRRMTDNNPDLPYFMLESNAAYMHGFLKLFNEKYRNINNYFKIIGLTPDEIENIRAKLLV